MDQGFEPELKKNKRSKVKFPCNKCDFVAARVFTLTRHVKNKQEGIRYPCSQCNYAATTANG